MTEPWPIVRSTLGDLKVRNSDGYNVWFPIEKAARHYAATPVMLETIRDACNSKEGCKFCKLAHSQWIDGEFIHLSWCPGIAALKMAGEKV